jgi:hypothetical protein
MAVLWRSNSIRLNAQLSGRETNGCDHGAGCSLRRAGRCRRNLRANMIAHAWSDIWEGRLKQLLSAKRWSWWHPMGLVGDANDEGLGSGPADAGSNEV